MPRQPFLITVVLAVCGAVLLLAIGTGATQSQAGYSPTRDQDESRAAHRLYGQYCVTCHGKDGKGTDMKTAMPSIPDFTDRKWQESVTDAQLLVSILEGKGTLMPGFRDRLSDEQTKDLVTYTREFNPAAGKAKDADSAK